MHYTRWMRHQDPVITKSPFRLDHEARFLAKVKKLDDGCWEWTAFVQPSGYGKFGMHRDRLYLAHRWAYEHWKGSIPDGFQVDHECHNQDLTCRGGPDCRHRRCVNPDHLVARTRSEQALRAGRTKRRRKTCAAGHPYTRSTLFYYQDGSLGCAICNPALPRGAEWPEWRLVPFRPGAKRGTQL